MDVRALARTSINQTLYRFSSLLVASPVTESCKCKMFQPFLASITTEGSLDCVANSFRPQRPEKQNGTTVCSFVKRSEQEERPATNQDEVVLVYSS